MPFAVAGAAITAGAGLIGSSMQSSAAAKGQAAAIAAQERALAQTRADLEPWRNTGQNALMATGNLAGAYGPDAAATAMKDFYTSPGYQFRLDEGMRGVDAGAAAKGMLRSGATLKAEQAYAQGLASSEFENYYNRLYNLSGMGLKAAGATGDAETQTGRGIAGTNAAGANTQASIYGNLASGLGNTANDLLSNKGFQNWVSGPSTPSNAPGSFDQYPVAGNAYTPSYSGVPSPY